MLELEKKVICSVHAKQWAEVKAKNNFGRTEWIENDPLKPHTVLESKNN
jgi:hypothetical protein